VLSSNGPLRAFRHHVTILKLKIVNTIINKGTPWLRGLNNKVLITYAYSHKPSHRFGQQIFVTSVTDCATWVHHQQATCAGLQVDTNVKIYFGGLFYIVVTFSTIQHHMAGWIMNSKGSGRKRSQSNRGIILAFGGWDWGKQQKPQSGQLVSMQMLDSIRPLLFPSKSSLTYHSSIIQHYIASILSEMLSKQQKIETLWRYET
jgi:hypothetical protein